MAARQAGIPKFPGKKYGDWEQKKGAVKLSFFVPYPLKQ